MPDITIQTDCRCWLRETWTVAVPSEIIAKGDTDIREHVMTELAAGRATFESQESSEEEDRTFVRVLR